MNPWVGRHLKHPKRVEKKIVKKSEMNKTIDRERKSKERVLECPPFLGVQITTSAKKGFNN